LSESRAFSDNFGLYKRIRVRIRGSFRQLCPISSGFCSNKRFIRTAASVNSIRLMSESYRYQKKIDIFKKLPIKNLEQPLLLFGMFSSSGLILESETRLTIKAKYDFLGECVLCWLGLGEPPPLFALSSYGG
jgi:hypothetical protein